MEQGISFDLGLIRRYDQSGPRYTSYPTAVEFDERFDEAAYKAACARSNLSGRPLSLYFHLPFCDTVCFYCACNKIATKDRSLAPPYLERLHKEIAMQSALFDRHRVVEQLHWGGGTPTFLSHDQMQGLMDQTRRHFTLADDAVGEFSIEIDPREADAATVALLRRIGFNRMSLGVQDFDPRVQAAVNRIQTEAETLEVLEAARAQGFRSISLDLIYGLPLQTAASFLSTLDRIIELTPDASRSSTTPTCRRASRRSGVSTRPTCRPRRSSLRSCRAPSRAWARPAMSTSAWTTSPARTTSWPRPSAPVPFIATSRAIPPTPTAT